MDFLFTNDTIKNTLCLDLGLSYLLPLEIKAQPVKKTKRVILVQEEEIEEKPIVLAQEEVTKIEKE